MGTFVTTSLELSGLACVEPSLKLENINQEMNQNTANLTTYSTIWRMSQILLSININHKIGDNGVVLDRIIWPLVGSEINTVKERMVKKMLRLENFILTKKMS